MRPQQDLVLVWGDFVVAQKRVAARGPVIPSEHFALPDDFAAHSLQVRVDAAEPAERLPRFRWDGAFAAALILALLTHATVAFLGGVSPGDEDGAWAVERYAPVAVSGDEPEEDGIAGASGVAACPAQGVAPAAAPGPITTDSTDATREAATFGMVSLLGESVLPPAAAFSPSAGSAGTGSGIWSNDLGGSGVDLSGAGEGGGGPGSAVTLAEIGGLSILPGVGHDVHLTGHVASITCHLHFVEPVVIERLDPNVIQRVVRKNEGRFRGCYAAGLLRNPALEGRVAVQFAIARDGTVATAQDTPDSELPDAEVRSCVVRAFSALSFPEPGGVVTVTYPIVFSPASLP